MDSPSWADEIMAWMSIGSFLATAIGLYAVYVQIKRVRTNLWSDTHGKLCDQSLELIKFMVEKPETRDYFYKNKPLNQSDSNKNFVLYVAEALTNFMEHLVLQQPSLPPAQQAVWQRFIVNTYENCSVMQTFVADHRGWYSQELLTVLDQCDRNSVSMLPPPRVP